MTYRSRLQVLILGFGMTFLSGCFQASIMPLPTLSCPLACIVRMKASSIVLLPVTLTQGGESKDTREYILSVISEINGLTLNFVQTKVHFEESAQLQITTTSGIQIGNYNFTLRATSGTDVFSFPLQVIVEL